MSCGRLSSWMSQDSVIENAPETGTGPPRRAVQAGMRGRRTRHVRGSCTTSHEYSSLFGQAAIDFEDKLGLVVRKNKSGTGAAFKDENSVKGICLTGFYASCIKVWLAGTSEPRRLQVSQSIDERRTRPFRHGHPYSRRCSGSWCWSSNSSTRVCNLKRSKLELLFGTSTWLTKMFGQSHIVPSQKR